MTKEKIEALERNLPIAIEKLINGFDGFMTEYDHLMIDEKAKAIIHEWRNRLTRDEIKELNRWVDKLYFAHVSENKAKGEE